MHRFDARAIAAAMIASGFLLLTAAPVLRFWYHEYTRPESFYGHAFLVPFLASLMLWHVRDNLRSTPPCTCLPALLVFLPATALLVFSTKMVQMDAVMSASFLLSFTAGIWFLFGTRWVRAAVFPLLFLWCMAPLPGPVLNDLTLGMQSLSTAGAAKLLALIGMSPVQHGNIIALENYQLNVDVPCSGFKLLLRLLTFSAAFAYLSETTTTRQILIFLFSLPLSLFINALRIALIGLVGECLGATSAHTFHDWSGLITTVLCMAILLGFARSLGCRRFAGQPIF